MKKVLLLPLITGIALSVSGVSFAASELDQGGKDKTQAVPEHHSFIYQLTHRRELLEAHVESAEKDKKALVEALEKAEKDKVALGEALKKLAELNLSHVQLQEQLKVWQETSEKERVQRAQEDQKRAEENQKQQFLIACLTVEAQKLGVHAELPLAHRATQAQMLFSEEQCCHRLSSSSKQSPRRRQQCSSSAAADSEQSGVQVSAAEEKEAEQPAGKPTTTPKRGFLSEAWYQATTLTPQSKE